MALFLGSDLRRRKNRNSGIQYTPADGTKLVQLVVRARPRQCARDHGLQIINIKDSEQEVSMRSDCKGCESVIPVEVYTITMRNGSIWLNGLALDQAGGDSDAAPRSTG
jgi:hypothetical protein